MCGDVSIKGLEGSIKKNKERLSTAASNSIGNGRPDRTITKSEETEIGRKTNAWIFEATN